jgi:hypothetical protein
MNATPAIVPRLMLAACLLALVTGCGSQADNAAADAEKKIEARIDAPPPPAPPADATPIQVQPGPRGTQVKLMSAKVTEDVLTVQLVYAHAGGDYGDVPVSVPLPEVTLVDIALAQSYTLLKDAKGRWAAGPIDPNDRNRLNFTVGDHSTTVWMRFPAPSPDSHDVTLNIPNVAAFEDIDATR